MYTVIWEFRPAHERAGEFEETYGSDGPWAQLFAKAPGFLGTELLRDRADSGRYLTIDRWESLEAFEAFRIRFDVEYGELDAACEELTSSEVLVGRFEGRERRTT